MKTEETTSGKISFFRLVFVFYMLFNFGFIGHAADFFVDDDTCPQTGSGTTTNPFCSIQYSLNQAVNGDTIYVYNGNYAEAVTMKTGVDLLNIPGEQPRIVTSAADNIVLFNRVSNCTINGFLLDDSTRRTPKGYAIVKVVGTSDGVSIKNCVITGANTLTHTGIRLYGQVSVEIIGNTINNTADAGIATKRVSPDTIYNSTVIIQGNTITQNAQTGIHLRGSGSGNHIIIGGDGTAGNTISSNGGFRGSGMWLRHLQGVSISNNEISHNGRTGIVLEDSSTISPHITGNSIHDNSAAGINIGGDSTLTIGPNNEIYLNTVAGITFFTDGSSYFRSTAASGPTTIEGNTIHTNARAGISVNDNVTGLITISKNRFYQNEKAGIAILNNCTAVITDNDIHDQSGAAGIFTGTWSGGGSPSSSSTPPSSLSFDRTNGPAQLTIKRNKIYNNLAGMRLDHASGTISNNLVYNNARSGIRFSGNDIAPYEPFGVLWGITSLTNNTLADNGTTDPLQGAGLVYDDINNLFNKDGTDRNFFDSPARNSQDQGQRTIQNNIAAYNATAGIKDANTANCPALTSPATRDYNLYFFNFSKQSPNVGDVGGCFKPGATPVYGNQNEFFDDPLFVDRAAANYQLQAGSPAINSGSDGKDLGAYGGSDPITW